MQIQMKQTRFRTSSRIIILLGIILALGSLAGGYFWFHPGDEITPERTPRWQPPVALTQEECAAKQGTWKTVEKESYCVFAYPDAWEPCRDSSDCAGHCLRGVHPQLQEEGTWCEADTDFFGCTTEVLIDGSEVTYCSAV